MSSERQVEHLSQRASGLNQLKCWVEALKLDAGIGCCKAPVSFDIVSVAVAEPSADLALEAAPVRDTPIETLIGQDSKLGLGHVEPAAVRGRVVPFEALDEAPCLQRRKCGHGSEVHPVCVRLADRHWDVRTVHYWRHC